MLIVATFWLTWPYKILEIKKNPIPVLTHRVHPGEQITFDVNYCKYMDIPADVEVTFVDEIQYTTPMVRVNNPTGCHDTRPFKMVPQLPPNTYMMRLTYTYHPNPLRTIKIIGNTVNFTILRATDSANIE